MEPSLSSLNDIRKVLAEQRRAFDAHLAPEREHLWRYCRQLTGSLWDAEDLVQETMVRAFGGLTVAWSPTAPRAYLFRIASRLWIDRQRQVGLEEIPLFEREIAATEDPELSEEALSALESIGGLPARQRVVVVLTQAFDFTAAEAADVLDISEGAVKALLHRARQTLKCESRPVSVADPALLQAFVDAFNRRDLDGLASLFHQDVRIDIIGAGEERGRDELKGSSIKYTLEDEDANEAVVYLHEDEPLVLLLKHMPDGSKAVSEVIRVEGSDGAVRQLKTYYYCPEALAEVAEAYGVPAHPHGYN